MNPGSLPHLTSVLQQGRKSANIPVSLGVIRGTPVQSKAKLDENLKQDPEHVTFCASRLSFRSRDAAARH